MRPVDRNLTGWRALKQSLSVFSDPSDVLASEHLEATEEDKVKRSDVERQLRMEQDTYESALGKWRSESEQLKRLGINSALTHSSFGAMMWGWHEALEPAVREEIKLANEAECKAVKTPADEERCQYGPFLQYLDPAKLSAITILTTMTALGTSTEGERGYPVSRLVIKIGDAVQDESIAGYLKTHRARPGSLQGAPQPSGIRPLAIGMKRRVKSLKNTTDASPDISAQALEGYQWSPTVKAHIGAVLLSKLIDDAKCRVFGKHPENGSILESSQRAFLHRFRYSSGRRIGMLSLNSSMYDHLAKEPVASSLAQKHLPMVVEPKSWAGFREGGFLTSTTPLVRMLHGYDQSRKYIAIAVDNGDMAQVCAGLDILSRTPWQINGPVFEVMLEAWNSGEAIGGIAPENPDIQLPPEPPAEDRAARCQWLKEVRRLGNEKAGHRSERCFQNFQLEIARAYLNETFYFPHNVDFRGRAYPMPPFLNHMGNDLCRGLLTFGVGKQLGEDGLRWLKIHLANIFGYDKASFEDRVKFVEGHLADILDSADRPLQGQRWWLGADDPWQCLAACKELKNALHSPDPHAFVSQLAIHQDGTCNGLQHYAALGGDAIGARQVNLEPGDKPSDVYTGVAELVQRDIAEEARQGQELAQHLDGKISRKVVKQTVMTNVYGVTFMGARLQVLRQLRDLYPNFPESQAVNYHKAAFYIAGKIFRALANMFNGAHDIQYWLGDCASRIATAVTPEQMQRIESAMAGTLNEPEDFQKKSLKRKGERGYKDELLSFKQSVIWTTPLKMPVVQPYRHKTMEIIPTHLQRISLHNPSLADPVNKRKQLQAFPPNFIHSLDATHMVLSALQCEKQGLTFAAVHDSFWTHASDVSTMNRILRDAFITMHSEDIVGRLRSEFDIRYKGCLYMTQVKEKSPIGRKILDWRGKNGARHPRKKELEAAQIKELLLERRRLKLLASEKPEERQEGEAMVTPCSLFEQSDGEADLAVDESIADASLGNVSTRRENKLQLNEELMVGDEENIDVPDRTLDDPDERAEADVESAPAEATSSVDLTPKKRPTRQLKTWLWRPLTFPPVPKKVCPPIKLSTVRA